MRAREVELDLAVRTPYPWRALLTYLAARAIPGVESVEAGRYRRTFTLGAAAGWLDVSRRSATRLRVLARVRGRLDPERLARRMAAFLDTGADPRAIAAHLGGDPLLAPALRALGAPRIAGAFDRFEIAVRAVLGQQVSVVAANRLAGRLVEAHGRDAPPGAPAGLGRLFPEPAALAALDPARAGMPSARAAAVATLAIRAASDPALLAGARGLDETLAALQSVKGIGAWTAHYVALRGFGHADAFPSGDLGLRRAAGEPGRPAPARRLAAHAERWRPLRGYAAMALWTGHGG